MLILLKDNQPHGLTLELTLGLVTHGDTVTHNDEGDTGHT
jgi:hypothetical protein